MSSHKDTVTSASEHLLGRVKWFNNKAGYGFVTITDGVRSGTDVFVHHSAVNVDNQQYKYLVQGEYVEFDLIKVESDKHEWQASRVSGIRGGKLMCETRYETKLARNDYKASSSSTVKEIMPKQKASHNSETKGPRQTKTTAPRTRGEGPRDANKKEWTLVGDKGKSQSRKPHAHVRTDNGSTIITIQSK